MKKAMDDAPALKAREKAAEKAAEEMENNYKKSEAD
jgi:hypothetical protein